MTDVQRSRFSRSTRRQSPPRFCRPLLRARSMRMRRIASAAAAKKWPRLFQPRALSVHQAEIRLVHQGRRLERLAGPLLGQLPRGQPAQLVVDQRQELVGGLRVALLDRPEDMRDVVHWRLSR